MAASANRADANGPGAKRPDDSAAAACDRVARHLQQGAPWDACDAFRDAVRRHAENASLLYWGALAHARAGSTRQARALLDRALVAAAGDTALEVEVIALGGRLWKDRLHRAADDAATLDCARQARDAYLAAYALRGDPYPGINAAALTLRIGDAVAARRLAAEVLTRLDADQGERDAWHHATAGEACLLLGDNDRAAAEYAVAFAHAPQDAGSVASMRRQLHLLARVLPHAQQLLRASPAPTVVAFAADAATDIRHDASWRTALRQRLAGWTQPIVVFASAGCGPELIFVEEALDFGAEVNVVLPFDRADFVRLRVAAGGDGWVDRFDAVLERAARVVQATDESHLGDDVLFDHGLRLLEGLASLRAGQLEAKVSPLYVRAGPPMDPSAQVRSERTLDRWRMCWPTPPDTVDLAPAASARVGASGAEAGPPIAASPTTEPPVATAGPAERPKRTLKSLLFADIAGFGRLHDAFAPLFHASFLRIVDEQLRRCAAPPLEANTWGDALYVVFAKPDDAAEFALALLDQMLRTDWAAHGLSPSSQIRIALHAGPVFCGFDPIIGRDNYFGSSVTQAARIEPITPPGTIYASEAFAASLVCSTSDRYAFEYMGRLPLAKGFGESRIYRLDRRG